MEKLFILLVLFQLKHFVADYPLQTPYMLGKFKDDWGFFPPLALHAGTHAIITFVIVLMFTSSFDFAFSCFLFDLVIHFFMDRIKAGKKYLNRWKPDEKYFWWALGFDQMIHHLTHYAIIAGIIFLA
jgi:hypothetical protein